MLDHDLISASAQALHAGYQWPAQKRAIGFLNFETHEIIPYTHPEAVYHLDQAQYAHQFTRLLDQTPANGTPTNNPLADIILRLPASPLASDRDPWMVGTAETSLYSLRDGIPLPLRAYLIEMYGTGIPSPSDIEWMHYTLERRPVIEIGAGNGYWAWQLQQAGIDVLPIDNGERHWPHHWTNVHEGDTTHIAAHRDRALMLVWPPLSNPGDKIRMAEIALDRYKGDLVIHCGEFGGYSTASVPFYERLLSEWECIDIAPGHVTYEGFHSTLSAHKRKG